MTMQRHCGGVAKLDACQVGHPSQFSAHDVVQSRMRIEGVDRTESGNQKALHEYRSRERSNAHAFELDSELL